MKNIHKILFLIWLSLNDKFIEICFERRLAFIRVLTFEPFVSNGHCPIYIVHFSRAFPSYVIHFLPNHLIPNHIFQIFEKKMESFRVTAKNYNDEKTQNLLKNYSESMTAIEIYGEYSEEKDIALYRDISAHCKEYLTKLELKFIKLHVPLDQITIYPNLKELSMSFDTLSFDFFKFNVWCPNLEILTMKIGFKEDTEENWLSMAEKHPSTLVRKLTIALNIDSKDCVYYCFNAMEKQFPMLEDLRLEFDVEMNFTLNKYVHTFSGNSLSTTYESLYFDNLKKLSMFAFGECDDIFNYLCISNEKLKEIHFMGMNADATLIKSLCNYPKLTKLNLDCPYVYEDELSVLCTGLPKLMTLVLDTKYFHWESSDMMDFIQKSKRLRHLKIDVDRKGRKFDIDEEFKKQFAALIESGRKFLTLHIKCFETSQEIELSRKNVIEKPPSPSSSSDESNGWF